MSKLFSTLTRDDAVRIMSVDPHASDHRKTQINILRECLYQRGASYYEEATFVFLRDLADMQFEVTKDSIKVPDCVKETYRIMFMVFEEAMMDLIDIHWEVEAWKSEFGPVEWSSTFFYEQEAEDYYNECLADGDKYIRMLKVDKEGMPIDIIHANF